MSLTADLAKSGARLRGRPREFDVDAALDRAIVVFAERGYQGASIAELKAAMGLASGSLYKAFPDKLAIFLAAFERYKTVRDGVLQAAVGKGKTGRDKVRRLLSYYAEASVGESGRRGCLVVAGATELALLNEEAARTVASALLRNLSFLADLIREGQGDGSISPAIDPEPVARTLLSLGQGLRVLGKTGLQDTDAEAVVETAMRLLD
ncbi:Copper outer membrane regulator [Hartmannibacter diazotrophicus]|uniref:Copper outer membrane regulator n=1 Tax=Hartmannibacter diazotrophicus TaxID=1482074 RepID=A0A2C9DAA3_9HYPH|nr:TetR/AcrR family transcriptional regulator [Hartmannibacter diazotrophicus]SON57068.1 Copper outer membrane regulator [Hartmannibacter diazotrophicus]